MKNLKNVRVGQPLLDLVTLCYKAKEPLLLIGRHGCGKSMVLEQAAEELEIGYICRDLSLMEPTDLVGMPKLEDNKTIFLPPDFLPTSGKGIMVFEELNRCPRYMRSPCLQLLTARTLNDYVLPKGWLTVAAVNPSEDGYEVEELDKALSSRFVCVNVVPDVNLWLEWAEENKIHSKVREYVDSDPDIFTDTDPRSWSKVSALVKANDGKWNHALEAAISGLVGTHRTVAFKSSMSGKTSGLPNIMDLLDNYHNKYRSKIKQMVKDARMDLLETLVHQILLVLRNTVQLDVIKASYEKRNALVDLVSVDLPPDLGDKIDQENPWISTMSTKPRKLAKKFPVNIPCPTKTIKPKSNP